MNIVLSIPNFRTAGSQFVVLNLYELFKSFGHKTYILIEDKNWIFPGRVDQNDQLVLPKKKNRKTKGKISYTLNLSNLLNRINCKIFHSWDYRSDPWEAIACRLTGTKYVYTKKNNAWSKKWILKSCLANHIAYDNPRMGETMLGRFKASKKSFIPHGIDTKVFYPGYDSINHVIGCIGNVVENKNQLIILKALSKLPKNIKVKFYGNSEPNYLRKLKKLIQQYNLINRVSFEGYVENDKLPQILHTLDAIILPSFSEAFGVILIEAMACGTYCIASHSGGGTDYILGNGKYGGLFPPNDEDKLVSLVEEIYNNPKKIAYKKHLALKKVHNSFTIKNEAYKYLEVYHSLV